MSISREEASCRKLRCQLIRTTVALVPSHRCRAAHQGVICNEKFNGKSRRAEIEKGRSVQCGFNVERSSARATARREARVCDHFAIVKFHASRARRNGSGHSQAEGGEGGEGENAPRMLAERAGDNCIANSATMVGNLHSLLHFIALPWAHRSLWASLWWRVCNLRLFLSLSFSVCLSLWDISEMKRSTRKDDNDVMRETTST